MSTTNLLPCPFCGGPVQLEKAHKSRHEIYGERQWWGVRCTNTVNVGGTCAIEAIPTASPEAAIERWNRRAPVPTAIMIDALDAALQRAAGELPDGYKIRVEVELGAGGVEWSGGDAEGSVDHQESLASDVLQALEDAKEHAAAAGGIA